MRVRTPEKRNAILQTARPLFVAQGFGGLTMDMVAAAVGGSKATLYRYFPSKDALFASVIVDAGADLFEALGATDLDHEDLATALKALGNAYVSLLLSPAVIDISRLVIAEAARFPEVGAAYFDLGPGRVSEQIGKLLARLGDRHGVPALGETIAARHFRALCGSELFERRLWNVFRDGDTDREAAVAIGVDKFLSGYLDASAPGRHAALDDHAAN